jgi:hypothetical protein
MVLRIANDAMARRSIPIRRHSLSRRFAGNTMGRDGRDWHEEDKNPKKFFALIARIACIVTWPLAAAANLAGDMVSGDRVATRLSGPRRL